ncbi:Mur ligase family protein, partial [Helicobacter sp. 'CLO3_human']|uniref:Mur ligase family protein n=1 Tax=Helicobacter sp. 'CLO3_human' TaxID=2020249 RepID=UPI002278CDC2
EPAHAKITNSAGNANAADSSAESILSTIPMIWISGTNGKTTTTQMLTFLLERFGAQAGGNIGTPLIHLAQNRAKIWVLETSSFAMHYTHRARPQVYLLLPLSPDHISWHGGFDGYVRDKLSVLARMDSDSFALLPHDLREHPLVRAYVESSKSDKSSARAESST